MRGPSRGERSAHRRLFAALLLALASGCTEPGLPPREELKTWSGWHRDLLALPDGTAILHKAWTLGHVRGAMARVRGDGAVVWVRQGGFSPVLVHPRWLWNGDLVSVETGEVGGGPRGSLVAGARETILIVERGTLHVRSAEEPDRAVWSMPIEHSFRARVSDDALWLVYGETARGYRLDSGRPVVAELEGRVIGADHGVFYLAEGFRLRAIRLRDGSKVGEELPLDTSQLSSLGSRDGVTIWHDAARQEVFAWRPGEAAPVWRTEVPAGRVEPRVHHREGDADRVDDVRRPLPPSPCWAVATSGPGLALRGRVVCVALTNGEVSFIGDELVAELRVRNDGAGTWLWLRQHDDFATLTRLEGRPLRTLDVRHAAVDMAGGYAWIVEGVVRERIAAAMFDAPSSFPEAPLFDESQE